MDGTATISYESVLIEVGLLTRKIYSDWGYLDTFIADVFCDTHDRNGNGIISFFMRIKDK